MVYDVWLEVIVLFVSWHQQKWHSVNSAYSSTACQTWGAVEGSYSLAFTKLSYGWYTVKMPGWWFGCHFWFSHILGISSSQLTNSYFSEGWPNRQPEMRLIFSGDDPKTPLWGVNIPVNIPDTHSEEPPVTCDARCGYSCLGSCRQNGPTETGDDYPLVN